MVLRQAYAEKGKGEKSKENPEEKINPEQRKAIIAKEVFMSCGSCGPKKPKKKAKKKKK